MSSQRARAAVVVGVVVAVVVIGVAVWRGSPHPIIDRTPAHPVWVDDARGSVGRVALGDPLGRVLRVLGDPIHEGGFPQPAGAPSDAMLPSGPGGAVDVLDYRGLAVVVKDGRVVLIEVTLASAQTRSGAGIGDSLIIAHRTYPRFICQAHDMEADEGAFGPPWCYGHPIHGETLTFLGDPIAGIELNGHPPT